MPSKANKHVKENYSFYKELLNQRKSIFSDVIEIKEFGNHAHTLEKIEPVLHPNLTKDSMILIVDIKINNHKYFQFKLRCKSFMDEPFFRFDSDGDAHRNPVDGISLVEQKVETPHFHKFNENGLIIAYKTDSLKNENQRKALEDINLCLAHFFQEGNIRLNQDDFPSVRIACDDLNFSFIKEDPNQNIVFK